MACDTKERILESALALFAQNGYLGTSMSDIARQLGISKAALYKHYASKQEILDRIVAHMTELDEQRAKEYQMPEAASDEAAMQLALEFYGPIYLLYSVFDGAAEKDAIAPLLDAHLDHFISKIQSDNLMHGGHA